MVFIPWQEIEGTAVQNTAVSLARAVRNLGCRVRQAYPGIFDVYQNTPGTNPIAQVPALNRYFWERVCRDDPIPNPGQSDVPFQGGQCPIIYTVRGHVIRTDLSGPQVAGRDVQGPIQQAFIRRYLEPSNNQITFLLYTRGADGILRVDGIGSHAPNVNPVTDWYVSFTPLFPTDQDNCGNRTFTPSLPAQPPTTFNFPTTIGGQQRNVQITLPTLDTGNWPSFEWTPTISFDGITAEFGLDGINIEFPDGVLPPVNIGTGGGDNTQVLNEINNVQNTVNNLQNTVNTVNSTVNEIQEIDIERILELIRCCCCEENVTYESEVVVTNSAGGVYSLPEGTVSVVITGNDLSSLAIRRQGGSGDSPDVLFWGHIAVCHGGANGGTRTPLQFASQSIPVEENSTGILVSPYYECRASVTAVIKRKNCNE